MVLYNQNKTKLGVLKKESCVLVVSAPFLFVYQYYELFFSSNITFCFKVNIQQRDLENEKERNILSH